MNEHNLWQKENVKLILVLCIGLVLLIGCGEPNLDDPKVREKILAEAIDENDLQIQHTPGGEERYYTPNQQRLHTGWVKSTSELWQLKQGKKHGIYISWYENSQKRSEGTYKDGSKDGLWIEWDERGQKRSEGAYKDGLKSGAWIEYLRQNK